MLLAVHFPFSHLSAYAWSPVALARYAGAAVVLTTVVAAVAVSGGAAADIAAIPRVAISSTSPVGVIEALAPYNVASVGAVHNRLVVTVIRTEAVASPGVVLRMDGGAAYPLPMLMANEHWTIMLDDLMVQRRAPVRVEVLDANGRVLQIRTMIVAPDEPNDLRVASIRASSAGVLTARVFNDSPIPLHGALVLAARVHPDGALLARIEVPLDVLARDWQDVVVGNVGSTDVARIQVGLATDAINDANISNDTYRP